MSIKSLKRSISALSTVLGMTRAGFFVPHRYAAAVRPLTGYPELEPLFAAAEAEFRAVLVAIDRHGDIVERFAEAPPPLPRWRQDWFPKSEEHTSELQSLMRISYAVFCLKKKTKTHT